MRSNKAGRRGTKRSTSRDLRVEQFEARVLLSITPMGDDQQILSWAPVQTASDWVGDTQPIAFSSVADKETGALWVDFDSGDGVDFGAVAQVEVGNLAGEGVRGEVSIGGAWFESTTVAETEFTRLTLPGNGYTGVVGEPALPVVRGLLTVPEGAELTATIVGTPRTLSTIDLGVDDLLVPVQPSIPKVAGAAEAATLALDEVVYGTDAFTLEAGIWLTEAGSVAGERLVMFEVVPISYNPVDESLTVFDTLTFDVSVEGGKGTNPVLSAREDARLADLALNYPGSTKGDATKQPAGRLLIVSHDDFVGQMAGYVTHKESLGWTVDLVDTSTAGTTNTAIRSYIQSRYNDPLTRPDALLLVGDTDRIPHFVGLGFDNPNTDLYYSCMGAGDDWQPEFPVGRFSVATSMELADVVDKTVYYETSASGDWTNKAAFIATDDPFFYPIAEGTHDSVIATYMDPLGYTSDKLYAITTGATTTDVRNAVNDGRALAIYSGHGYEFGWAGPSLTQSDVASLMNNNMYPFVGSFACLTGDLAMPECFMETWLREPDKGAVVAMGSSVTSYWDEDDILEKRLFDAMYGEGNLAFGSAMVRAKELYLQYWGATSTTRRYFEMYNMFGDPTVELVTRTAAVTVGPELVAIIPNEGDLLEDGEVLNIAPRELLFRFNEGQRIDPDTLDAIQIVRSGGDDVFGNPSDVIVEYGWVGIGDYENEAIVRFADTLPDDKYEIWIVGSDSYRGPDNQPVAPLLNLSGLPFNDGTDEAHPFELDLGAQVIAVVPQPVVRGDVEVQTIALTGTEDKTTFVVEDSTILPDGTEKVWVVTFEFDVGDGVTPGNHPVLIGAGPAESVASWVKEAIQESIDSPDPNSLDGNRVTVSVAGNTVTLAGARVLFYPVSTGFTVQSLDQHRDEIEVYFNDDPLKLAAAANTSFYQLIVTNNTATPADDKVIYPDSVSYNAVTNKAVLTFTQDLADPVYGGTGAFRLRVGNDYEAVTTAHAPDSAAEDRAGGSFHTAESLISFADGLGPESLVISAEINPKKYDLEWPGAVDEPGQRDLPWYPAIQDEDHYVTGNSNPDAEIGITTLYYNFRDVYGYDPQGVPLYNLITEAQKERTREIFELYGSYLGVQFYETEDMGYLIATGDLRASGWLHSMPGGTAGYAFDNLDTGYSTALMDNAEPWGNSEFGGNWFEVAMHEIGHLMGYGHSYDVPPLTVMGSNEDIDWPPGPAEQVYPGDNDIVHGLHMYRPESLDIDLYQFTVPSGVRGTFSAETLAERMDNSSLLDTTLTLYEEYKASENGQLVTKYRVISRNDDYYSEDSYLQMYLREGTYYVGVTASGNDQYDPNIANSGIGGVTQGIYDLRLNFTPGGVDPDDPGTFKGDGSGHLIDATGTLFDGDTDGVPGGAYNFWFNVQPLSDTTRFVDKLATDAEEPDGSLAKPYKTIPNAFADAQPGDIVRILGNNFDDDSGPTYEGNYTYNDNLAYEIGRGVFNNPLGDGVGMQLPQGVTVMIDAGAMFKLRGANIDVGSSAEGIDRSGSALQVLGIPGLPVYFTSYYDETLGVDTEPNIDTVPAEGNWGGLVFRNDLDYDFIEEYDPASGDAPREVLETQGIFLNYVNHADVRYGGGQVTVHGVRSVYTPIHMLEARPTATCNTITSSADAAISGDPNSFADSKFENWDASIPFTASYERVGPDVHGNKLKAQYGQIDPDTGLLSEHINSINGVFVRVQTNPGEPIKELEVPGRLDDWDIVHVVSENLFINGTPGGPVLTPQTCPLILLNSNEIEAVDGGSIPDGATFSIADGSTRVVFEFDRGGGVVAGHEPIAYTPGDGRDVIATLVRNAINKANTDHGLDVTASIAGMPNYIVTLTHHGPTFSTEGFGTLAARIDARLLIDPGMIVKMDGSRIEAEIGAQFIAEGRIGSSEGAPGYEVIFTSLLDNRYGAGGSFNTSENTSGQLAAPGDWAGFYFGPVSEVSINNAVIAYAGGVTAIEGGFASFDPIEIRQAHARITNSRFEHNTGAAETEADRPGRGSVEPAAIFVRGAQPVIAKNDFLDNDGPVVNINVNSLQATVVPDWGRSTGGLAAFDAYDDNHGPLVYENRMTGNGTNGMVVRGGTLTTEVVWDDTDIVHVLRDEIVVDNFHHYGGLRLQSSTTESLVVKLYGDDAGFTAEGTPLEIDDRIGGTVQVLGTPGHPVVLTSLGDDSVGAGFQLDGTPQVDTDGTGVVGDGTLPTGPEVNNGTLIDDDVAPGIPGQFAFRVTNGGSSGYAVPGGAGGGISAQGLTTMFTNQDVIFEYLNYIDVGINGNAVDLGTTTITTPPTLISDDRVMSEGNFTGPTGTAVNWHVETYMQDGDPTVYCTITLNSTAALGDIRLISYLDEDVLGPSDDLLILSGTPGQADFRAFTLDGPQRVGFSHGGIYQSGSQQVNATYDGFAADRFADLRTVITTTGTTYSINGNIDTTDLPLSGGTYGPADVTTAFAWTVDPTATTATVTSILELVARAETAAYPGDWQGIKLDAYANDRNVAVVNEREQAYGTQGDLNGDPFTAQLIGALAGFEKAGDDNLRLGFEIHGNIRYDDPSDVDVYSFDAAAGTEIWLDIDRSTHALDTIIELIDADGKVLARSDNSVDELDDPSLLYAWRADMNVQTMDRDDWLRYDFNTTNPRDAGMRLVLPGPEGQVRTYYVRVRSSLAIGNIPAGWENIDDPVDGGKTFTVGDGTNSATFELQKSGGYTQTPIYVTVADDAEAVAGLIAQAINDAGLQVSARVLGGNVVLDGTEVQFDPGTPGDPAYHPFTRLAHTSGAYRLQLRLGETEEVPGSTVQYADIRYATNGIELLGFPGHSPLLGETAEREDPNAQGDNDTRNTAEEIGNLLAVDRNTISLAGRLNTRTDVDWYEFTVDYEGIQSIPGLNDAGSTFPVVFDMDYADGMARTDTQLFVFDSQGRLILKGGDSNVVDDRPDPTQGAGLDDLSRGSAGPNDPFIGPVYLPEGRYYVAVTSLMAEADILDSDTNPLTRIEPVDSVVRIAEEHFNEDWSYKDSYIPTQQELTLTPEEFHLGDVIMYINTMNDVYTMDPFTGVRETDITHTGNNYLTNTRSGYRWHYNDIAMRNDGRLMTLSGRPSVNFRTNANEPQTGRYQELDTGDGKIVVSDNDSAITTWEVNPNTPTALRRYASDVEFEAMVHETDAYNDDRHVFAVGSIYYGYGVNYTKNLMFVLENDGTAIQYYRPQPAMGTQRLGTHIVPFAYIMTQPTLFAVDASVTRPDDDTDWDGVPDAYADNFPADGIPDNDVHDGDYFALSDVQYDPLGLPIPGITETFEFDAGLDVLLETDAPLRVRDGDTFEFDFDPLTLPNPELRFEFDSAEVLVLTPGFSNWQDGDRFTLGAGFSAVTFEFDKAGNGLNFGGDVLITPFTGFETADELMTLVVDAINKEGTYEADGHVAGGEARVSIVGNPSVTVDPTTALGIKTEGSDGVGPGSIAVPFEETWHVVDFARSVESVIEASPLGVEVGYAGRTGTDAFGARITIDGIKYADTDLDNAGSDADAWVWQVVGEDGVTPGNVPIPFHADDDASAIAEAVAQAINFGPTSPFAGGALAGAKTVTLYSVDDRPDDTGLDLFLHDSPIKIKPDAIIEEVPGTGSWQIVNGDVTGLAYVGDQLFAVDDRGGLFAIYNEKSSNHARDPGRWGFVPVDPQGSYNYYEPRVDQYGNRGGPYGLVNYPAYYVPETRYVAEVEYQGNLINFTGLTSGPENVEGGRYADLLFATDSMYLYALNMEGELQPVFADGAYRVQLPTSGVRGVDFSNVDYNMWHQTWNRRYDDGHGIERTYDDSRISLDDYQDSLASGDTSGWDSQGRTSWYFGMDDPRVNTTIHPLPTGNNYHEGPNADSGAYYSYDMPGGAHGILTSSTFSLDGYSFQDKPTLYFNYYGDTENTGNFDGLRVYVSKDGAQWDLAATSTDLVDGSTNDGYLGDVVDVVERPGEPYSIVKEVNDGGGSWRQVRINLSKYAGEPSVQVRFDFSTASCMHVGDLYTTGEYLTAVPVWEETTSDGDYFSIGGQSFEFDLGYALAMPNAAGMAVPDQEWFQIDDGSRAVRFEFDKDFSYSDVPIYIGDMDGNGNYSLTASDVAARVVSAINLQTLYGNLDVYAQQDDERVFLVRAVDVQQAPPPTISKVTLVGDAPGTVSPGSVPVPLVGEHDRFGNTRTAIRAVDIGSIPADTVAGRYFMITGQEEYSPGYFTDQTYYFMYQTGEYGYQPYYGNFVYVDVMEGDSAETLAAKIVGAINTNPGMENFHVRATQNGADIVLDGPSVSFYAGNSLLEPVAYPGSVSETEVAEIITEVVNQHFADPQTSLAIRAFDVSALPSGTVDGMTFGIADQYSWWATVFELDTDGSISPSSDVAVSVKEWDSASTLAMKIANVVNTDPALASFQVAATRMGSEIVLSGGSVAFDAGTSLLGEARYADTIQAAPGSSIANMTTFSIRSVTERGDIDTFTFQFFSGTPFGANVPVQYSSGDSAEAVAWAIAKAINTDPRAAEMNVVALATGAGQVVLHSPLAIFHPGDTPLVQVDTIETTIKWDVDDPTNMAEDNVPKLMHVIGHYVDYPGLLGHGNELYGDHVRPGSQLYDRFIRYERGQDNRYQGFYVDDVVIGFAERGEMITASATTPGDSVGFSFAPITVNTPPLALEGEYQLEIRRGEDYAMHYSPPASMTDWLYIGIGEQVDTNHRLSQSFTIKAPPADEIYHGQTFTIDDGLQEKTFVFIDETVGGGGGDAVPIYFNSSHSAGGTRDTYVDTWGGAYLYTSNVQYGISDLIRDAINGATDLNVTAETILTDGRVDLFGAVSVDGIKYDVFGPVVTDTSPYATQYDVDMGNHLGDQNLERQKGQIVIECNSIMYSQEYGIVVGPAERDPNSAVNWPHPASGRTLNAPNDLVAGIMIENNLLAFGGDGGILFSGDTAQPTGAVPFGRLVNNTVYGGSPGAAQGTPGTYGGVYFPQGAVSFADQVVSYEPDYGGGPVPDPEYANAATAVGVTDFVYPNDGSAAVSLGNGGRITLAFTDNLLTGSGDYLPDLHIFEVGRYVENVFVEISRDGVTWYSVGAVTGATSSIDIDAYGFGLGDTFAYVRLTDDSSQGEISAPAPGADIDAVGVISTTVSTGGTGIRVENNASPTVLNNIVANLETGIYVDASSVAQGTVIGATIYQRNGSDVGGAATFGNFDRQLLNNAPLFVNPNGGNFYLQEGSEAIDSSIDALEERQGWFNEILEPVGIPVSPIKAPGLDLFGQLRVDDPSVSPPPGLGSNVFKDRGAIDRVDFEGPAASLVVPLDNDPEGLDRDPTQNDVTVAGEKYTRFSIQLMDMGGVGIDDTSVTTPNVEVYQNLDLVTYPDPLLRDDPLTEGVHYFLNYDSTNDVIHLIPAPGIWAEGNTYTIILDNTQAGIRDLANNALQPNRFTAPFSGKNVFIVSLSGLDFGDAPDPTYPSLLDSDGARHLIAGGYYLGSAPSSESDARENFDASGDLFDDGVWFNEGLIVGNMVPVTVNASQPGQLEAWIDFNADGDWDDAGEKLFNGFPVDLPQAGDNTLSVNLTGISLPGGVDEVITFGRFRFWSGPQAPGDPDWLDPAGEARNGEVEDYQLRLVRYGEDYGDAPDINPLTGTPLYPTTRSADGARHRLSTGLWLGASVDPELDGQPSTNANGDDINPITGPDDEDGIQFVDPLIPGNPVNLIVTSSLWGDYLNAWIDFNKDGDWDDPGEQVITDHRLRWLYSPADQQDMVGFLMPSTGTIVDDATYARFRLSSAQGLGVRGLAPDGEVEDYRVSIVSSAIDYGDAPDMDPVTLLPLYPTMLADDGARHNMVPNFCLGEHFDYEFDGQPDATATGDDVSFLDDEDGIEFVDKEGNPGQLMAGEVNTIRVTVTDTASRGGYLNAWIDYNGDGDWDDLGEKIIDGLPVNDGMNALPIDVPEDLVSITTFARFRFSSTQELSYTTTVLEALPDGEVEDYMVPIIAGDASISGRKFDDLNANGDWDTQGAFVVPYVEFQAPGSGAVVMPAGDDNASSWLDLGFTLQFFGDNYDRLYINNNGVVTFTAPLPSKFYIPAGFPQSVPLLAPFWADVDTRIGGGSVHFLLGGTSSRGNPFVQVDWVDVGYYNRTVTGNLDTRNTFSLYIEDDPGGDIVAYRYWDMSWTTGDATGTGGFGLPGDPTSGAQIGFDAGDFAHYVSEARPSTPTDLFDLLIQGQYVYRFDPATGEPAGAEPGLAGVVIYVDENNDGQLDYIDLDGDGQIDFDTGEPTDRWTVTMVDDPTTPGVDETGYFEFSRLFAGDHVIREYLVDPDWVQTYPGPDFSVPVPVPVGSRQLRLVELDPVQLDGALLTLEFDDGTGIGPVPTTFEFDNDGSFNFLNEIITFTPDDPVVADFVADTAATVINNSALGLNVMATASRDVVTVAVILPGTTMDVSVIGPFDDVTSHAYYTVQDGGWYLAELEVGESLYGVDFGDFRKPNIRVSDAAIAEGNSGLTEVQVTLHLTESFGAPVTIYYHTDDGTGANGATVADNDYVPVLSGSHTFTPQGVPVGVWTTESLTSNASNDYDYSIWGSRIVWEGFDGHDWEVYLYDYETEVLTQLSDNDDDDRVTSIHGSNVAWVGGSGASAEIYFYDIDIGGLPINISQNSVPDSNPQVSDGYVVWESRTTTDQEIYLYDISAGGPAQNISDNNSDDYEPQISGDNVVWSTDDGVDREIYVYQVGGAAQQLTSNNRTDRQPQIDGSNIVWEGYDGNDYEVFLYQIDAGTPPLQITWNDYSDTQAQISGQNIVWTGYDAADGDFDIYHYSTVLQWTSNVSRNNLPDEYPRIAGDRIVWNTWANSNWEVFYSEVGTRTIPVDVSNHPGNDWKPQVSEDLVVWRSYDNTDYEIVVATQAEPELTETITLYITGDTFIELDEYFYLEMELAPEWVGLATIDDPQAEVHILNDDGQLDYGDAPAPYPTLLADNGARHVTDPVLLTPIWLGSRVDAEGDGQPNATATGDDVVTSDDEDGVVFDSAVAPGANAWVTVTASAAGKLDAWIDFNGDGDWGDAGEQIFTSTNLAAGATPLMYSVPAGAGLGETFARFRFSSVGGLSYTGSAPNGEVEDYSVQITPAQHGVEITQSDSSTEVSEDGATDSYTVVLTSQPVADVQISLATPDGQLHVAPTVLTFTSVNWATPQVVTVGALDDDLAEGLHNGVVIHTATSLDLNYNGISIPDVTAQVTDNDTAGVEITESAGTTNVTEDGATDTYQMVLTSQPTGNVTITLTPDSQVSVAPIALLFTSSNWYVPQVVTVSAVDDGLPEGSPHTGTVSHSASSLDPNYSVIFVRSVTASITDNDPAEVRITESDGYTEVSEDGDLDAYDVVLTMQPTAPVVVTVTPDSQLDMAVTQLTFNQFNWSTPQQVVVSAVDDDVVEGPHTGMITHSVSSADVNYDGIAVAGVTVNITDNDAGVWLDGRTVIVQGSSGADVFEFTGGDPHTIVINGAVHQYAAADVDEVVFDGDGGNDRAIFNGTAADELMEISPDFGRLSGGGVVVTADNVRWIEAHTAGGNDTVRFDDSPTDDMVTAWPNSATMTAADYSHQADGFETLLAYAKAGGSDTARLYDSPGDDQLQSTPTMSWLGGTGFFNRVKFFDIVLAYAREGGNDTAAMYDSPGNDAFTAQPGLASMSGSGYFNRAKFFDSVTGYASAGYDYTQLYDSPGDDTFVATPEGASLTGAGFSMSAYGFDAAHGYAKNGGIDVAMLYDSVNDDTMVATPTYAKLTGLGFYNRAKFFDYVHGYAKRGGRDVAYLYDSPGDDTFVGTPTASILSGTGFYDRAKFFEEVYATASTGNDRAYMYDAAGTKDRLEGFGELAAPGHWASMSSDTPALDYMYWISDFDSADCWASDVDDEENVDPSTVDWLFTHGW